MIVYITINKINKSYYVGITNGNNHSQKGMYLGSGKVLKQAVAKYGRDNFRRFTLEECNDRQHASVRESAWIAECKRKWPDRRCYNLTVGGENGEVRSSASNKKIADSLRRRAKDPQVRDWYKQHAYKTLVPYTKKHGPGNRVITDKDVAYIRQEYSQYKKTLPELALEFGVSVSCIHPYVQLRKGYNGSGNGAAKLREPDVLKIRDLYRTGDYLQRELAEQYDVAPTIISRIVNRKIWTHID